MKNLFATARQVARRNWPVVLTTGALLGYSLPSGATSPAAPAAPLLVATKQMRGCAAPSRAVLLLPTGQAGAAPRPSGPPALGSLTARGRRPAGAATQRTYFLTAGRAWPVGSRRARNAAQHLTADLAATCYTVSGPPAGGTHRPAWAVSFQLRSVGRAGAASLPLPAAGAVPLTHDAAATYGTGQALAVDYLNSPAGVRQTYRLARRPAGRGPVQVRLMLATRLHVATSAQGTALTFRPALGGTAPVLRYTDLRAWDATGRPLAARLRLHGPHELALEVQDAGARYPVTIDPLASIPAATLPDPPATLGDSFGASGAGVGDVNGDSYADVVVGSAAARNEQGQAYLYLGSATGLASTPAATLADPSATVGDAFGGSVVGAGDVNKDGYADVLVGAAGTSAYQGQAYLYLGSAAGLASTPATTLADPLTTSNDAFGASVTSAGDVNGDGYADVLVGAAGTSAYQGKAYLYLGSAAGLASTPATTLADPLTTSNDAFGASVTSAGDVNGDGYADVLVGAAGTSAYQGKAYLYLGSAAGLASTPATTLADPGATASDAFGGSVAAAGDVNGDGYADVLVGAPHTTGFQGKTYLYLGSAMGLASTPAATLADPGATLGDAFGGSVAGAGDVNKDGYADVLVGAAGTSAYQGKTYLYAGGAAGLASTPTVTLADPLTTSNDYFGRSVASAGDVNGDGYADMFIGGAGTHTYQGQAYLYLGSAGTLLATTASTPLVRELSLYPNPTSGAASLSGADPGTRVQVLDALGRLVGTATADARGQAQLAEGLRPGLYLVLCGQQARRLTIE